MDEKELEELRDSVRKIDSELAGLFEKRLELSRGIALYKLKAHKPIYDAEREEYRGIVFSHRRCELPS